MTLISNKAITRAIPRIGDDPPREFCVLPKGTLTTPDGLTLTVDDASCKGIIDEFVAHGIDFQFDFEHASELEGADIPPDGAPAAAWARLESRADGVWATDIKWVGPADEYVRTGRYRYWSPVMLHEKDGHVVGLKSAALTNQPRLDRLQPLMAAKATGTPMPVETTEAKAMTLQDLAKHLGEQSDKHHDQTMACITKMSEMFSEAMKHMSKGKDDDESEDDEDEDDMKSAKAKGLIEGSIGTRITGAEARDLLAKLEAKTINADYVESFITAKVPVASKSETVQMPVSFGFTDAEVARCKSGYSVKRPNAPVASKISTAQEADAIALAACKALGHDPVVIAKAWAENCERAKSKRTLTIDLPSSVPVNAL